MMLALAASWAPAAAQQRIAVPTAARDEPLLERGPNVVTLQGFIVHKRFYGPPNHGEHPKTDRKTGNWLLILPEPVSVRFAAENDNDEEHVIAGVSRITLNASTDELERFLKRHSGEEIEVVGTLYSAPNVSWYWARIALDLQKASLLPRSTERSDRNLGVWDFE